MRRLVLGLAALLAVTGCGTQAATKAQPKPSLSPTAFVVAGTASLVGAAFINTGTPVAGGPCTAFGRGPADVRNGAQVVVRDDAGKTVGLGRLLTGRLSGGINDRRVSCDFRFTVPGITSDADFLSVQVGNRRPTQFKKTDAQNLTLRFGA